MDVCVYVCLCTMYMLGTRRGQKRESDTLKLELCKAVNYHVGTIMGPQEKHPAILTAEPSSFCL